MVVMQIVLGLIIVCVFFYLVSPRRVQRWGERFDRGLQKSVREAHEAWAREHPNLPRR
jgi:hypothetical protein